MPTIRWIAPLLAVLALLGLSPAVPTVAAPAAPAASVVRFESSSFAEAQAKARLENRPLMVDLYADT